MCWNNALDVVMRERPDAIYVEGWVVNKFGMVVEHGWVEADGEILEVTPVYLETEGQDAYFSGMRYKLEDIASVITEHEEVAPPFVRLLDGSGFGHYQYRQAYRRATLHAFRDNRKAADMFLGPVNKAYPDENLEGQLVDIPEPTPNKRARRGR